MRAQWLLLITLTWPLSSAFTAEALGMKGLLTQYAGNIGMLSAGVRFFESTSCYSDLFLGIVPKPIVDQTLIPVSVKMGCQYRSVQLNDHYQLRPYNGFLLTYTHNDRFNVFNKPYEWDYYRASLAYTQLYAGIDFDRLKRDRSSPILYMELGIPGIYLSNWIDSPKDQPLSEMFNLALGLRWYF